MNGQDDTQGPGNTEPPVPDEIPEIPEDDDENQEERGNPIIQGVSSLNAYIKHCILFMAITNNVHIAFQPKVTVVNQRSQQSLRWQDVCHYVGGMRSVLLACPKIGRIR